MGDTDQRGLEMRKVTAGYRTGVSVLDSLSLRAHPGLITGIIGPNGAGKSTALKTIAGLVRFSSGAIIVDGVNVGRARMSKRAWQGIVYVPQTRGFFPFLSVQDNLSLFGWTSRQRRDLQKEELERIYTVFPVLHTKKSARATSLSGGEQRQLEFARAMLGMPRLVLLDEPSTGMSPQLADRLYDSILQMKTPNVTIVLADQNVAACVEVSDYIYELQIGKVSQSFEPRHIDTREVVRSWLA